MIDQAQLIRERLAYLRFDHMSDPYMELKDIEEQMYQLRLRYNYLFESIQARKLEREELEEALKELEG